MQRNLLIISNLESFKEHIKEQALETFLLNFNSKNFLKTLNNEVLGDNILNFIVLQYITKDSNGFSVHPDQVEEMIKEAYQEIVEASLSKLVDLGVLEMCWDSELNKVFWRKGIKSGPTKSVRPNKRKH